jgi:pilus assembly protein Flp/PilA
MPIDDYMIAVRPYPLTDRQAPMREQKEFAMNNLMSSFLKDETAATAIEYGLIAAGISVAIIAVVQGLGTNLKATFGSVSTALK